MKIGKLWWWSSRSQMAAPALMRRAAAMAALALAVAVGMQARAADTPSSHFTISVLRYADTLGNSPYYIVARLSLADADAQQIIATIYGEQPWEIVSTSFTRESANDWYADIGAATLEQLKSFASGTWQIEVLGDRLASCEFTLSLASLTDADLPPTPVVTSPLAFDTNVASTVQFAWSNPWAPGLPDRLELNEWSANGCGPSVTQQLSSVDATIAVNATTWQPPSPLGSAFNLFRVTSTRYATPGQVAVSAITNLTGSIRWGVPPGAPPGHPAQTPLGLIGSHRTITFEVRAPRPGDLNNDGIVDGNDLGTLLGNWG